MQNSKIKNTHSQSSVRAIKNSKLTISPKIETERIVWFIRETMKKAGFGRVAVGVSGGVDSAVVLSLCVRALGAKNVAAARMPYWKEKPEQRKNLDRLFNTIKLEKENIIEINIAPIVDSIIVQSQVKNSKPDIKDERRKTKDELVRLGNIMARARMTVLYDLAKQDNALVCGTENKSEYLLGYFTRFGDEASDLEPIRHLYKTQVYHLAKYLRIPKGIINKKPTAGLWKGQTDEGELGFYYEEADWVLFQVFEKSISWEEIESRIMNHELWSELKTKDEKLKTFYKIKKRVEGNWFKKEVPYIISNKLARHKQQVKKQQTRSRTD